MIKIDEILKLSTEEKKQLIDKIWDSIPDEDWDLSPWQVEEGTRRLEAIERGEATFTNWSDFKKELYQRLKK